ncbi:hypothetical protein Q1695_004546 [Nippostrongylus brasiliensis]|nr:hypothetical protein Q1695_004546 [Nippostrongylus brasiliensis]
MGWMAWAAFGCRIDCESEPERCIRQELFMEMADKLVEDGYLDVGYNRIHIDDCWMARSRNSAGELEADPDRFPSGMKNLAKYMHDRGLELGIYADYGAATCMRFPGSMNREEVDAKTFASWDIDYLKMDGCHSSIDQMNEGYPRMQRALNATGRPIVFSCSWPFYVRLNGRKMDLLAVRKSCNLWRFYDDVLGGWEYIARVIDYVDQNQDMLAEAQQPGAWNDMDMIVAGTGTITPDQARVQMTLWSIWSSPLILSNDLRHLSQEFREILQNEGVIGIDQDPLGIMGKLVRKENSISIYVKPVTPVINGLTSFAVAFVNMDRESARDLEVSLESLGLVNAYGYLLRDLWMDEDLGHVSPSYVHKVALGPTSASMIKLTIQQINKIDDLS